MRVRLVCLLMICEWVWLGSAQASITADLRRIKVEMEEQVKKEKAAVARMAMVGLVATTAFLPVSLVSEALGSGGFQRSANHKEKISLFKKAIQSIDRAIEVLTASYNLMERNWKVTSDHIDLINRFCRDLGVKERQDYKKLYEEINKVNAKPNLTTFSAISGTDSEYRNFYDELVKFFKRELGTDEVPIGNRSSSQSMIDAR